MRLQPNRDYISDDVVQTPPKLARQLVQHFKPSGYILEPCKGEGNFLRALRAHARGALSVKRSSLWDGRTNARSNVRVRSLNFYLSTFNRPRASRVAWCEIKAGRNFFDWTERVDWIVTNPPWSQIRPFLQHAMRVADNVVFLLTINHVWTKARIRDVQEAGFGIREIVLVDMPATFPQSGFQLGAVHFRRGWRGEIRLSEL
jgi:hypothetical protein